MIKKIIAWIIVAPIIAFFIVIVVAFWKVTLSLIAFFAFLALVSWAIEEIIL